jgi:hypothetical protein
MIRVCKMCNVWYAYDFGNEIDEDEATAIKSLVEEGIPVLLVEELEDVAQFYINPDEIEIVT